MVRGNVDYQVIGVSFFNADMQRDLLRDPHYKFMRRIVLLHSYYPQLLHTAITQKHL